MVFEYLIGSRIKSDHSSSSLLFIAVRTASQLETEAHCESIYQALAEKLSKKLTDSGISLEAIIRMHRWVIQKGRREGSLMVYCYLRSEGSFDGVTTSLQSQGFATQ